MTQSREPQPLPSFFANRYHEAPRNTRFRQNSADSPRSNVRNAFENLPKQFHHLLTHPLIRICIELIEGDMSRGRQNVLHVPIHPLQHCEVELLGAVLIQLRWHRFPILRHIVNTRYKRRSTPPFLNLPSRPKTHRSLCSPPGHHIITTLCSFFVSLARQLPSDCSAVVFKDFAQIAECYVALASHTLRKVFLFGLRLACVANLSSPPLLERVFIPCCPLARSCVGQFSEGVYCARC